MTFRDFMTEVRTIFNDNLNAFLEAKELSPVRILPSLVGIEKRNLSLAVFPTASNGNTFQGQGGTGDVRFTVQFFCNREATANGLAQGEEYFSALLEFIQSRSFGEESSVDGAVLCRMDEGEPVNGAVFLIGSRMSTDSDSGWY